VIDFSRRFRVFDEELPSNHRRKDSIIPPITLLEIERLSVERRYFAGRQTIDEVEDTAGSLYRHPVPQAPQRQEPPRYQRSNP
jgi:hypothetical protein